MTGTFAYTVDSRDAMGNGVVFGTYTCSGNNTGSTIVTGLNKILFFGIDTNTANAVFRSSASGGTVTITTVANQTGDWVAFGY